MATVTIEQLANQKLAARIAEDAVTIATLTAHNEFLAQTIQQMSAANAEAAVETDDEDADDGDADDADDVEAEPARPASNRRRGGARR